MGLLERLQRRLVRIPGCDGDAHAALGEQRRAARADAWAAPDDQCDVWDGRLGLHVLDWVMCRDLPASFRKRARTPRVAGARSIVSARRPVCGPTIPDRRRRAPRSAPPPSSRRWPTHHPRTCGGRHQTGDPFRHRPHGVREMVPDRGALTRDFTHQSRHHAPIATSFSVVRRQIAGDVVVQGPGVAHPRRTGSTRDLALRRPDGPWSRTGCTGCHGSVRRRRSEHRRRHLTGRAPGTAGRPRSGYAPGSLRPFPLKPA